MKSMTSMLKKDQEVQEKLKAKIADLETQVKTQADQIAKLSSSLAEMEKESSGRNTRTGCTRRTVISTAAIQKARGRYHTLPLFLLGHRDRIRLCRLLVGDFYWRHTFLYGIGHFFQLLPG